MARDEITKLDDNSSSGSESAENAFNNNNNNNNNNESGFHPTQEVPQGGQKKESSKLCQIDLFFQEAALTPADCGNAMELPPWFDLDKFKNGQSFMRRNLFSVMQAKLSGLICLLAVPSILRVLCLTKQSGENCSAFNRYYSTLSHMFEWYEGDLLEPGSKAYQSLKQVRNRHLLAAKKSRKTGLGLMSQFDMIVTQFGFFGFALTSPKFFALTTEKRESWEGFLHFWRTIGFLLGIDDRFNLCTGTLEETKALCLAIQDKILVPGVKNPPSQFSTMAQALITGMQCMIPHLNYDVQMTLLSEEMLGFAYQIKLSIYATVILAVTRFVQYKLLTIRWLAIVFRPYFNSQVRLAIYITAHFPFIAYWRYGKRNIHYH